MSNEQTHPELLAVMTTSEIAAEFGIDNATVRQAILAGYIAARKSGGTWLVRREDATQRWQNSDKPAMHTFHMAEYISKRTKKQKQYAGELAREIRDRMDILGLEHHSAHSLAKYFTIDDLIKARDLLRDDEPVQFIFD